MRILDTDVLSLLFASHPRVTERFLREEDEVVSTVISRIEILEGRKAAVMKAADGEKPLQAQDWLRASEEDDLPTVPRRPAHRQHRAGPPCHACHAQHPRLPAGSWAAD
jgi:hypothetical protein